MNLKYTAILVGLIFSSANTFADVDINEGEWEISTKVSVPGMPMEMPAASYKKCLTKKDLVPQKSERDQNCEITDYKVSGNTVSWKMNCSGGRGGDMSGDGNVTYNGDTFSGTMNMMVSGNPPIVTTMNGKRIGACK